MKKPNRILFTAVLATTVVASCNGCKEIDMKKNNKKSIEIINNEIQCIYGPPEMFEKYYNREQKIEQAKDDEEIAVSDETEDLQDEKTKGE